MHLTTNHDVAVICRVWTVERREEGCCFKLYHPVSGLGKVHRRKLDLSSTQYPYVRLTFEEDASKQSSSPILDRPTRILEKGRSDIEGIVASNSVVAADGAIS